jgi:hypothetical protein
MDYLDLGAALGILEAKGRITPRAANRACADAGCQARKFRTEDRNKKYEVWLQSLKDAEQEQEAARQREALAKANPPQRPRIDKKCPHGKQASRCQVFECPFVAVARVHAIELFSAYASSHEQHAQECGGAGICAHDRRRDQCKVFMS